MSKYTVMVKDLVHDYSVSIDDGLTDIDSKLDKAREYIFDFWKRKYWYTKRNFKRRLRTLYENTDDRSY